METDYDIEIGNITEELYELRRQLEQERQDHREHIAFLQKTAAQQIQQAHLRSGWPSAWELWVCRPDRNQDWRRYGLYETHAQAAATMRRVEGPPLELKIVPLYSAFVEHEQPSIFEKTRESAAKLGETIAEWDRKFGDKAVPNAELRGRPLADGRVDRRVSPALATEKTKMPTLRFEGYSDDTFGEVAYFEDDYDNCASGEPIEYLVAHRESGMGLIVTGQHCPGHAGSWLIGVANWDPDAADTDFPRWPMRIEPQNYRNGFQPSLVIEAPEGVTLTCLQRHGSDEG